MENPMLRNALRTLQECSGLRQQLEKNILGKDHETWLVEFKKFLRRELCWAPFVPKLKEILSAPLGTVFVQPAVKKFVVANELAVGDHGDLKIASWGHSFKMWFGDVVDEQVVESWVSVRRILWANVHNTDLVNWFGEDARTKLYELRALLSKQFKSPKELYLNHPRFTSYVSVGGGTAAVYASWSDGPDEGWNLDAVPVHTSDARDCVLSHCHRMDPVTQPY